MTDTPDKEWIERARAWLDSPAIGEDHADLTLAALLQSSFDQGVERERERCARIAERAGYLEVADPDGWCSKTEARCQIAVDVACAEKTQTAAAIRTPTPTEGERERVPTMIVSPPQEWTQELQSIYEAEMERKREQRVLAGAKFYARASAQRAVNGVIPEWDDEADEANWQHTRPDIREGAIDMVRAIIVACEFKQRQENAAARAIKTLDSDAGRAALGEGKEGS